RCISSGIFCPRVAIASSASRVRTPSFNPDSPNPTSYLSQQGTSFAAPIVAGGVALLADYAWTSLPPANASAAVDGRVMKAVLINSADKTGGGGKRPTPNRTPGGPSPAPPYPPRAAPTDPPPPIPPP